MKIVVKDKDKDDMIKERDLEEQKEEKKNEKKRRS